MVWQARISRRRCRAVRDLAGDACMASRRMLASMVSTETGRSRPGIEGNGHSPWRLVGAITLTDIASRRSLARERMRRHRRRREAGQQCVTLTLHEYQVLALVACGFLGRDQQQNREAVADALRAYLSEWAMPPLE
jgi:hypothetical protein